jgi:hypothetical protein
VEVEADGIGREGAALRREIHEGLNVVETWNSTNDFIFFGKGGEVASNRLEDQEISVHALHLLQSCLVYVNTLMLQRVLAEPAWMARMMPADLRAFAARLGPRQPLRRLRPRYEATARPGYPCRGLRPGDSLRKAHFVRSVLSCRSGQQGVAAMPMEPPEG